MESTGVEHSKSLNCKTSTANGFLIINQKRSSWKLENAQSCILENGKEQVHLIRKDSTNMRRLEINLR